MEHISLTTLGLWLLFLILVSGFFSGSETGMMSINRYRLRHLVKKGDPRAKRVQRLLDRPDRLLGVILIGNNFANIVASALMTMIAGRLYGDVGIAVATILLTLIVLIFAEVTPKTLAAIYPSQVSFAVSRPLRLLLRVLYPFVWLINAVSNGVLRLLHIKVEKQKLDHLSGDELRTVVNEAGGLIPQEHKDMMVSILDLEKISVEDIMIPRNEIVGIDLNDDWSDIREQLTNSEHTRLPIYQGSIDSVTGVLHLRSLVNLMAEAKLTLEALTEAAGKPYFTPEGTPLNTQLLNFQKHKVRSALVVDEYGDIQGLVTLEDLLEEIVGEFTTDASEMGREIHPQEDGSFYIDGSASVRDINQAMNWKFPTSGPKTISGLIIEQLEAIPSSGTSLRIGDYLVEIIKVQDNTVKTAKVKPMAARHSDAN